MSNYRDDTQETAVASSSTWLGLKTITESTAKISGTFLFGLMVTHCDVATASDEVIDRASHIVQESASVSDEVLGSLSASVRLGDEAELSEEWLTRLRVLHSDSAVISDSLLDGVLQTVSETASIADEVIDQRRGQSLVVETAKASDSVFRYALDVPEASAEASDKVVDTLRAIDVLEDAVTATSEVIDGHTGVAPVIVEMARTDSEVIDSLHARDLVVDLAVIEDSFPGSYAGSGQAWTANVDTWAMSRYEPYGFSRVAVIDGIAYGESESGVYALTGGQEQIEAKLITGKLDLGKGQLVKPVAAYTEYQLSGTAEMDVTSTQRGTPTTYTYTLPAEQAEYLTNGRFVFGRGLRGRHFSFALRMTGEQGAINDLSVDVAQTKRRV